jgi:hypothetical protein
MFIYQREERMLCTGCGTQPAVIGRFCSTCDSRARSGSFERRRPVGGSQWQALWGISYADTPERAKRRRHSRFGVAAAIVMLAMFVAL